MNPNDILIETKNFYDKLYSKDNYIDNTYTNTFFPQDNNNTLNDQEKLSCEGFLTEKECFEALKEMKNNKSPGSDGITTEFYKIFWTTIKTFYIKSINYSYTNGSLTTLQKQGIITLLPKKDKDLTSLNNWRPITLLNIDYKIATK